MFYRYTNSAARVSVDLDGLFHDQDLYLLGGAPSLAKMDLDLLRQPGIVTLAMNNVPYTFSTPTLWLCLDKPVCFSPHIYADPRIMKFTVISRRDELVGHTGKKVWQMPNLFFFGTKNDFKFSDFLRPDRDLVWWKSVFPCALMLAHRLGFRRVHLVGCGFDTRTKQYAWKTALSTDEKAWSQRTYDNDLVRLGGLAPVFKKHGFQVISCTPNSRANGILGYVSLQQAVEETAYQLPRPADSTGLRHSSKAST